MLLEEGTWGTIHFDPAAHGNVIGRPHQPARAPSYARSYPPHWKK
jgi:hypothetical protein